MRLPYRAVNRPITTLMGFLALLLFGIVSLRMLPLDVMPKMELPALTVMTVYPGASSEEVEEQVTKPLERRLSATQNLKKITSKSKENVSSISLEFRWNEDITEAANNARDMIEQAKMDLPQDARKPFLMKVNSSMFPVIIYGISADENFKGIKDIIENEIATPVRKVEGVGSFMQFGDPSREIQVHLKPNKLQAYNLSIQEISTVLEAENVSIPAGNIKVGKNDYAVRVPGDIESADKLGDIPLTSIDGTLIRIRDVADITDSFEDKTEYTRSKFGPGVAMMVQKQTGANTLDVIQGVRQKMEEIRPELKDDVKVTEILATDEVITESINNLTQTLFWALLFVVLVVFIFLRNFKSSLIVFITIPFSLIVAFIVMYALSYTINIFSLMSLVIAIGMVVDNAIVVTENIVHHIERGSRSREGAKFGTSEMGMAITASTATTLMVFIPMVFMGGIVGVMFKQLAILTSATMLASLLTSLSLTPAAASQLFKGKTQFATKASQSKLYKWSEQGFIKLESFYKGILHWVVHHKAFTLILALLIFAVTLFFGRRLSTDYIPEFDAGDLIVVFETEVGTSAEQTDQVAKKVMKVLRKNVPERAEGMLGSVTGQTEQGLLSSVGFSEGKNVSTILCHLVKPSEREASAKEIGERIRGKIEQIPEIQKFHITAGSVLAEAITGSDKPIEVEVTGNNLDKMNSLARRITKRMKNTSGFIDLQNTIDKGKLEIQIQINKQKASQMALNTAMIASQVRQSIYGQKAGTYNEEGEEYDIMIRYDPEFRQQIENLKNIVVTNLRNQQIPLKSVATIEEATGKMSISHKAQERVVYVSASLQDIALGEGEQKTREIINELDTPQGIDVQIAGQVTEQGEAFQDLYLILILGIALVYMVMAAQFESFKDPFIIMFAIPFTFVGVIWAFFVTGLTLSVTTFIGVIMLMGIVVNNGIVLVDYIKLLRARGNTLYEAVLEGGRSRMRPVLMTSFTTILAMLPMALQQGMGKAMYSPLGITIIGGMLVSSLVTLLIVPTIYATFHIKVAKREGEE